MMTLYKLSVSSIYIDTFILLIVLLVNFIMKHYFFTDRENFYTGRVFGEKASDVKLHVDEGVITGIIHTPEETYHIEVK